ncbi:hypothetical protein F0562_017591 [Nyssa sinensis]|uniref:Uncharacterized protein n=1 Tax=Nyssa sinensis TaxID=561372 RepID=A0A5J4ZIB2_9ASTE|nr:hypothetical protein F0562_017591 [Nyssa sinensis]
MAEKIAFAIVGKIAEYFVEPIGRQFGYLCCYKSNIENHRSQVEKLENIGVGVQLLVDDAKRKGEIVGPDVEAWQTSVNRISEEAKQVVKAKAEVEKGCLNGWCPNLKLRYSLSRKAKKKTKEVVKLQADGKFKRVSYPAPLVEIPSTSTGGFKGLQSRISMMKEIIEALKDDKISMIGICGMGGVGKTTMVEEVKTIARNENLFDEVAMTLVSKTPDVFKIQREFADMLGLILVEDSIQVRAKRLHARLTNGNRILVILDDVWGGIDLREVGIPLTGENKKCKVVLTSRLQRVCSDMEIHNNFIVQVLAEQEAWDLFKEMAGNSVDSTTDLHHIAKEVAKECGGLPIALVTVGKALKNKEKHAWNDALRQLRRSAVTNIPGMHKNVYACIELSYSHLECDQAKSLLLLCCLFPEDYDIPIEFLVRYGVGLRLFEDVETVAEARDTVYSLVDELRSCYLLLAGEKMFVKLHDVIRDVGISIASKGEQVYMVRHDIGLKEWPEKETYENYTAISLTSNQMHELPAGLDCPQLKLLQLLDNYTLLNLPRNFFAGLKELRVIGFYRIMIQSTGPLLQFPLINIRTLCLDFCKSLPDLSIIGSFKKLEILSFFKCCLDELPSEIGQLSNLKLLDLRCAKGPAILPPSVLSNLYKLEELYVGANFSQWKTEENCKGNASIRELNSLSNLNTLSICVPYAELFFMEFTSEKLMRFGISTRSAANMFDRFRFPNSLILSGIDMSVLLETGIKVLLKRTEILDLEVQGSRNFLNEFDVEGFVNLKELLLHHCDDIEYLIDATDLVPDNAFINLESLSLHDMSKLKEICKGNLPAGSFSRLQKMELLRVPVMKSLWWGSIQPDCLGNLRFLHINYCDAMKSLFTPSIVKGLVQLEELKISDCRRMEEIVAKEGGEEKNAGKIEFPKLKLLRLSSLQNLKSFYPKSDIQDKENGRDAAIRVLFNQQVNIE